MTNIESPALGHPRRSKYSETTGGAAIQALNISTLDTPVLREERQGETSSKTPAWGDSDEERQRQKDTRGNEEYEHLGVVQLHRSLTKGDD